MLFFISPVSSLVQNFSEEKALLRVYLGLTESMSEPITNSVGEFQFYYNRFLGYLIYNLENTIAEIEAADTFVEEQELEEAAEQAKADIFPAEQEQPAPTLSKEEKIEIARQVGATKLESADQIPSTPTEKTQVNEVVAVESEPSLQTPKSQETDEIFNELQSKSLKERMLICKNHAELEQLKSENPELVTKVWDSLSILTLTR